MAKLKLSWCRCICYLNAAARHRRDSRSRPGGTFFELHLIADILGTLIPTTLFIDSLQKVDLSTREAQENIRGLRNNVALGAVIEKQQKTSSSTQHIIRRRNDFSQSDIRDSYTRKEEDLRQYSTPRGICTSPKPEEGQPDSLRKCPGREE